MSTKQQLSIQIPTNKLILFLLVSITLSACSTTKVQTQAQLTETHNNLAAQANTKADITCKNHAQNIAVHAELTASSAQYLAAARAMSNCVSTALQNRTYNNSSDNKKQQTLIMQMMATATLNYIKSGDVITAAREVKRFKRIYPNKDLYFEDYTSFLDTATALLSLEPLGSSQMSSLNISRVLREEIERKQYWLNH